ncbi:MAG: ATP-binding protein [Halieaceae bacterium]|nr:ATP-binding protein [Halieaceae bacterium]
METGDYHPGIAGSCLRNLLYARCVAIMGHAAALLFLLSRGTDQVPAEGYLMVLGALTLVTLFSFLRLTKPWPVHDAECLIQLLLDILALTALLYFSGGSHNPLAVYYLVLVGFGAITMPRRYSRVVTLLCIVSFVALVFRYQPIPIYSPTPPDALNAATVAGWLALLMAAVVLSWFGGDMAVSVRKFLRGPAEAEQGEIEQQHLAALASLAAGTAEELGTPLATMTSLVEELGKVAAQEEHREDFLLLVEQLEHCRVVLDKLSKTARLNEGGELRWIEVPGFVEATVNQWLRGRPEVSADVTFSGSNDSPRMEAEYGLSHALEQILNNAADAEPRDIRVDVSWDDKQCQIRIDDNGPGFPDSMIGVRRKPAVVKKTRGMGIGLLICNATVTRYGGTLELSNTKHGARVLLTLPRTDLHDASE